jgi:SAM-dependent methyltransferase
MADMSSKQMLRLINIGCGTNPANGWINFDRSPGLFMRSVPTVVRRGIAMIGVKEALVEWPQNVYRVDATRRLPFRDASVDAVYSSHMLEHLSASDADRVLHECARVLKPDAVLRLALPDLRALAQAYMSSESSDAADRFMQDSLLGWSNTPKGLRRLVDQVSGSRHRWMYDADSIQLRCQNNGFTSTKEWGFQSGRCPDLGTVEHRALSLFVEAYR